MIGIGVGIDYALLVVTRYRESWHAVSVIEASPSRSTRLAAPSSSRAAPS